MGIFKQSRKDKLIKNLTSENERLRKLNEEKDEYFKEMISEGLRRGSPLAAKHMSDRKKYLRGK